MQQETQVKTTTYGDLLEALKKASPEFLKQKALLYSHGNSELTYEGYSEVVISKEKEDMYSDFGSGGENIATMEEFKEWEQSGEWDGNLDEDLDCIAKAGDPIIELGQFHGIQ